MQLRFWGVRGSLATPGPGTVRYGGNTLCVEIRVGSQRIIIDAGSGIRVLGSALAAAGQAVGADLLISHTHLDHICGLPFFAPLFDPATRLRIWGGHLTPPEGIERALRLSLAAPLMPNVDQEFRAKITFHDFAPGDDLPLPDGLRVRTVALSHPGNAVGFRIDAGGASVCYLSDTEHPPHGVDESLRHFAAGASVLIYDATYTDVEYRTRIGWGHSTWREGVRLADAASVNRLVLFHHDPAHDDSFMDGISREVAAVRPGSLVAAEGMTLHPGQE
jgi:phosphoribosyl 1,2-cyclic phosphodiesterase